MTQNYLPLSATEDNSAAESVPQPLNSEEREGLVDSLTTSLSDSEDDSETIFEDSLSHPLTPQVQTVTLPRALTASPPSNNDTEEEEKPEPRPQLTLVGLGNDGVFSNLSAKPHPLTESRSAGASSNHNETPAPEDNQSIPSSPLPNYDEAMLEPSPPGFNEVAGCSNSLSGMLIDDLLVEGLPVGGVLSFLWSGLIAQLFPYIGFLLTYLLHINHAGRLGSTTGLGLTLVSEGLRLREEAQADDLTYRGEVPYPTASNLGTNLNAPVDTIPTGPFGDLDSYFSTWAAYLLMIFGWIIILRSVSEYVRLRKERLAIMSSPESGL